MSKIVQCELRSTVFEPLDGTARVMVTWLDANKGIKPGDKLTLRDFEPAMWWEVIAVGQPHERSDIRRGWGWTDYMGKEDDRK